jgi:hypothetical protein
MPVGPQFSTLLLDNVAKTTCGSAVTGEIPFFGLLQNKSLVKCAQSLQYFIIKHKNKASDRFISDAIIEK